MALVATIEASVKISLQFAVEKARKLALRPTMHDRPVLVPRDIPLVTQETIPTAVHALAEGIESGQISNGLYIFYGPAGTGKTASIKWLAQQTGCKLLYESGSSLNISKQDGGIDLDACDALRARALQTSWAEKLGSAASWLGRLFSRQPAIAQKPVIVLIDEGDWLIKQAHSTGGKVLAQLRNPKREIPERIIWCVTANVIKREIMIASNVIDQSEKHPVQYIEVPLPNPVQQMAIVGFHANTYQQYLTPDFYSFCTDILDGLSGADIKYAVQRAWARAYLTAQSTNTQPVIGPGLIFEALRERQQNRLFMHAQLATY